jgi:hypothetical protein
MYTQKKNLLLIFILGIKSYFYAQKLVINFLSWLFFMYHGYRAQGHQILGLEILKITLSRIKHVRDCNIYKNGSDSR